MGARESSIKSASIPTDLDEKDTENSIKSASIPTDLDDKDTDNSIKSASMPTDLARCCQHTEDASTNFSRVPGPAQQLVTSYTNNHNYYYYNHNYYHYYYYYYYYCYYYRILHGISNSQEAGSYRCQHRAVDASGA